MTVSFVDSPFTTKTEYEAYAALPADKQAAALEVATKALSEMASPQVLSDVSSWSLGVGAAVGDKFPDVLVHIGFLGLLGDKAKHMTGSLCAGKKTLWVPGLKKAEIEGVLEELGLDMVYIFCVNDGAVMTAWKKDQGLAGSDLIEFVADTQASLTEALGAVLTTHPGPASKLGAHTNRCKRTAMYVVDGVIKVVRVAEAEDDPAGDDRPEATLIESMKPLIEACGA